MMLIVFQHFLLMEVCFSVCNKQCSVFLEYESEKQLELTLKVTRFLLGRILSKFFSSLAGS